MAVAVGGRKAESPAAAAGALVLYLGEARAQVQLVGDGHFQAFEGFPHGGGQVFPYKTLRILYALRRLGEGELGKEGGRDRRLGGFPGGGEQGAQLPALVESNLPVRGRGVPGQRRKSEEQRNKSFIHRASNYGLMSLQVV